MKNIIYFYILVIFCILSIPANQAMAQEDWNDVRISSIGKVAPHTNVIPYADEGDIAELRYFDSPFYRSFKVSV